MQQLPVCRDDLLRRGWDELDVIFVTGDAYVDHPSFGVPLLARWLEHHGFRIGIIAQPDWRSVQGFTVLGRPRLCFAVAAGAMDSMVAHYTPQRKLRHDDAYTPGNRHGGRPNRATIVYTGRLKEAFQDVPVVIGGIEASLRRFAHYDYWDDKVRRSILLDSKADILVYGMGERPLLEVVQRLGCGEPVARLTDIRGTASVQRERPEGALEIPSWEEVVASPRSYVEAFRIQSREQNPYCGRAVSQRHAGRWLVCNPPALPLTPGEMDLIYALPFTREPHPSYGEPIPAHEQIRASITTHRGCFGGCSFCAISHHQGKFIQCRSEASIAAEIRAVAAKPWFRGSITDLGGPTANMYGAGSGDSGACRGCRKESCLWPTPCSHLAIDDGRAARLLRKAREIAGVKNIAVSSGIRYDLLERQPAYFHELLTHHVGGLLKVAPEHTSPRVLDIMRKPHRQSFERFLARFREASRRAGKRQAVVPYLMAGHPGATLSDMADLALFLKANGLRVEQVQEFTPTPGTRSTCIYHAGIDPDTGRDVEVCRKEAERRMQKEVLFWHQAPHPERLVAALRAIGREDAASLCGAASRKIPGKFAGPGKHGAKKP